MKLQTSQPIVFTDGTMQAAFRDFLLKVGNQQPIVGEGSPEGVVTAPLYSVYLDTTGSAGSIQYRKMTAAIGGDTSKGWVAV